MKKVNLQGFDNSSYYNPGPLVRRVLWFFVGRIFVNTYLPIPSAFKCFILRAFGANIGNGVVIKPKVNIKYPWFLEISDYTWIGEKVWIDNFVMVKIGSNCCLSQECMLLTGNHDYKSSGFELMPGGITIEEGAWVGAKSVVTPGRRIDSHGILTVGSILTKDIDAYEIWQGNPAAFVRIRNIVK